MALIKDANEQNMQENDSNMLYSAENSSNLKAIMPIFQNLSQNFQDQIFQDKFFDVLYVKSYYHLPKNNKSKIGLPFVEIASGNAN